VADRGQLDGVATGNEAVASYLSIKSSHDQPGALEDRVEVYGEFPGFILILREKMDRVFKGYVDILHQPRVIRSTNDRGEAQEPHLLAVFGRHLDGDVIATLVKSLFKPLVPYGTTALLRTGKKTIKGLMSGRHPTRGSFEPGAGDDCTPVIDLAQRACSIFVPLPIWELVEEIAAQGEDLKLRSSMEGPLEPGTLIKMILAGLNEKPENERRKFKLEWGTSLQPVIEFLWAAAHHLSYGD